MRSGTSWLYWKPLPEIIRQEQLRGQICVRCDNVRKNDEVFPVEVSTRMLREEDEPGVVTYVRDLTEQVQAARVHAKVVRKKEPEVGLGFAETKLPEAPNEI